MAKAPVSICAPHTKYEEVPFGVQVTPLAEFSAGIGAKANLPEVETKQFATTEILYQPFPKEVIALEIIVEVPAEKFVSVPELKL